MTNKIELLLFLAILALGFTACEKDDPLIPNEEELITTLEYTLTPISGGDEVVFLFKDIDGDGGDVPIISSATLAANLTYTGSLILLNESEMPAGSITDEIREEDEDHQFFFQSDVAGFAVMYNDQDQDGNPLGLSTTLTTGDAGTGTFTIILRHEPNKSASGVFAGDITNAGGETDIEVAFSLDIQ